MLKFSRKSHSGCDLSKKIYFVSLKMPQGKEMFKSSVLWVALVDSWFVLVIVERSLDRIVS